jgi:glycosyltransferase involved in cell wall biosynthesis
MRIAQVLSVSTGGIGRHVASVVPRLLDRGHQVKVFCPQITADAQGFGELGAQILPLHDLGQARHADLVHAHGYKAGALAAAATLLSRPPLVVSWHNAILSTPTGTRLDRSAVAGRALQRVVARAADLTLGASTDLVDEALRLGARRARLGPVAAPVLPPRGRSPELVRRSLGLSADDVVVLTVSRLAPQKNLGLVLDVAKSVRERSTIKFLIVGQGPEQAALEQRIAAERSAVTLLGRRDDIADLLGIADLALLTSTWEARALVAQEALLAGVPLISTRVGGIEELVGEAAVLVELGDSAAAARAVLTLAEEPQRRQILREAGRARAATWPDEDQVVDDLLAAYTEVVSPGSAGQ